MDRVIPILRKSGADLTLISDESGRAGKAYVTAIPHMLIIGKDGRIAAIHIGYSDEEIPVLVDEINEAGRQEPEAMVSPVHS